MAEQFNWQRYINWLFLFILASSLFLIAFVIIVDPYNQYNIIQQQKFNLIKPALERYQNEIKLSHTLHLKPDTLIFGNSRAEIGFDPEAPIFKQKDLSAYNLSIPGIGIEIAYQQLLYLTQNNIKPQLIILGVEFLDFIDLPSHKELDVSVNAAQLFVEQKNKFENWFWRFDSLFSLSSVKDAFRTLLIQNDEEAAIMTDRGFNPLNQYKPIVRAEGYYKLFQQRAQENAKSYLKKAQGSLSQKDFLYIKAILDLAKSNNSKIILVIYPYHAQILALFEEANLLSLFDRWKQVMVNEVINLNPHSTSEIALYDFSGYSSYHCERIPPQGDRLTNTKWYWESGHFKKELGDILLEKILTDNASDSLISIKTADYQHADIFGFELSNHDNLESNQGRIFQERSKCKNDYPELFSEVKAMVKALQ